MTNSQHQNSQHHNGKPSFLPENVNFAMIDGEIDTDGYDQVVVPARNLPPTIQLPIDSSTSSDDGLPAPPPAVYTTKIENHHYETMIPEIVIPTTVTKMIDPPKKGCSACCSFLCLLLSTVFVVVAVLLLAFGWHEKLSFGDISQRFGRKGTEIGEGNLTVDYFVTDMVNTSRTATTLPLTPTTTILSTPISTTPPTTTPTTPSSTPTTTSPPATTAIIVNRFLNATTLTLPYGWNQPIKNVTAKPFIQIIESSTPSTTTAPTAPAPTTFEEIDKNVFGNMSIFLSDKNRFVVSPFMLNYILSFIGKFGDASTKSVISDKYFGVNDVNQIYDYYSNLEQNQYPRVLINAFISGDNPRKDDYSNKHFSFMEEITTMDKIPFYPSSPDRSYEDYYNEYIRKKSYDKENFKKFFNKDQDQLKATPKKLIGFSHHQKSLKFEKFIDKKIADQEFMGIGTPFKVDMFVNYGVYQDSEEHRLYQIPFADDRYTFFIVRNRYNHSIPNISVSDILKSVKDETPEGKKEHAFCIPEISQQNTYDMSKFINSSISKELTMMFDQPIGDQILDKYYQAIRFDVRAEGVNMKPGEHEAGTFKCEIIDRTFIYGVFYNDKENPSHEALLYYGLFI